MFLYLLFLIKFKLFRINTISFHFLIFVVSYSHFGFLCETRHFFQSLYLFQLDYLIGIEVFWVDLFLPQMGMLRNLILPWITTTALGQNDQI